jgi:hypothetical protein
MFSSKTRSRWVAADSVLACVAAIAIDAVAAVPRGCFTGDGSGTHSSAGNTLNGIRTELCGILEPGEVAICLLTLYAHWQRHQHVQPLLVWSRVALAATEIQWKKRAPSTPKINSAHTSLLLPFQESTQQNCLSISAEMWHPPKPPRSCHLSLLIDNATPLGVYGQRAIQS